MPGMLSVASPASDWTSTTFSGGTPNFWITPSRSTRIFLKGSQMPTLSETCDDNTSNNRENL
eukprot:271815-Hanusia_phi.AAC.2